MNWWDAYVYTVYVYKYWYCFFDADVSFLNHRQKRQPWPSSVQPCPLASTLQCRLCALAPWDAEQIMDEVIQRIENLNSFHHFLKRFSDPIWFLYFSINSETCYGSEVSSCWQLWCLKCNSIRTKTIVPCSGVLGNCDEVVPMSLGLGNGDKSAGTGFSFLPGFIEGKCVGRSAKVSNSCKQWKTNCSDSHFCLQYVNCKAVRVLLVKTPPDSTVLDFEVIFSWMSNVFAFEAGIRKKKFCSSPP